MELSEKSKILGMRYAMTEALLQDAIDGRYDEIQKLAESFNLSNKQLIKKLEFSQKIISNIPSEQIFIDWCYVIYDESEKNSLIIDEFYNLYKNRFRGIITEFEKVEKNYEQYNFKECRRILRILTTTNTISNIFLEFLLFHSNIIRDTKHFGIDFYDRLKSLKKYIFQIGNKQDENLLTFNSGENILLSMTYKKYLKKRRTELAEYMSIVYKKEITENNLAMVLNSMLKSPMTNESVPLDYSLGGVINSACEKILINHYGGWKWYENITLSGGTKYDSNLNYKPDIDDIIEKYYIQLLRYKANREKDFSKVYLLRDCKADTPLIDLLSIMFMYNVDIFSKLFMNLLVTYYENFSWEKITNKSLAARYDAICLQLEDSIQDLKDKLSNANIHIQILDEQLMKEKGSKFIPLERVETDLVKKLEAKDKEIENLKQQLRSKDEFIELLKSEEVNNDRQVEVPDMEELQIRKYLFVGRIKEAMPEIRKTFSNSIFMENETFSLKNIKVDGVIMLIKYMSHSMFYKVKSSNILVDTPIVYCNTKNINLVYQSMFQIVDK